MFVLARARGAGQGGRNGGSGDLDVTAGGDFLQGPDSSIEANGTPSGYYGYAGNVDLVVGGDAVLGDVDLSGPSGGFLTASVEGRLMVSGNIDARGSGYIAIAGVVDLRAGGPITISSRIDAHGIGSFPDTIGGTVVIAGAAIDVEPSASIDTRAGLHFPMYGVNQLESSGPMTIAGTLLADDANRFVYQTVEPVITGRVEPPPQLIHQPTQP